ncbi:MAG: Mur ligase family protein, partial [Acidimicrobiia bacterium]
MNLAEIAELLSTGSLGLPGGLVTNAAAHNSDTRAITDLAFDSRSISPGSLFICWRGDKFDGHEFAPHAVESGAAALLCERELDLECPQLMVENGYRAMNRIASPFFGYPSRKLKLAGVTGTNGKTTTTFMLHSILSKLEPTGPSGLIGTIQVRAGDQVIPGVRTTPQSADLQRLIKKMVDSQMVSCAMEATSVGMSQGRIDGCEFDICVFTNLSQDHLDDHRSM